MKKKLLVSILVVFMCFALTGCGDNENKDGGANNNPGGNGQQEEQGVDWPSNEYTNLIPKPEGATISSESKLDNVYYVGHNIDLEDWTIEECKAYAEKLKEAGFTTPGSGMSSVVVTDTESTYSFGAENSEGIYITVGSSYNTGRISIQKNKNE